MPAASPLDLSNELLDVSKLPLDASNSPLDLSNGTLLGSPVGRLNPILRLRSSSLRRTFSAFSSPNSSVLPEMEEHNPSLVMELEEVTGQRFVGTFTFDKQAPMVIELRERPAN